MNRINGKIAEQSKRKLAKGLLDVMARYDFCEITVTQIAQEAQLSRKTFYRLFSGKDDVMEFIFNELSLEFIARIRSQKVQHYWDAVQLYFDFCESRKELLLLLRKNNLLSRLFEVSYRHSLKVFEYVRSKETVVEFAPLLPFMLAYSVGGMNSTLI